MIELIDVLLPLGILLAMLLSLEPKRSVIAFSCICTMVMITIDYLCYIGILDPWTFFYSAWGIEFTAFIGLFLVARRLTKLSDRFFTRLMGAFFFLSCIVTVLRIIKVTTHPEYVLIAEFVATLHVLAMLGFSDGFRVACGRIHNFIHADRSGVSDLRG